MVRKPEHHEAQEAQDVRAVEQLRARARPPSALAADGRAGTMPLRRARAAAAQGCSRLAQRML